MPRSISSSAFVQLIIITVILVVGGCSKFREPDSQTAGSSRNDQPAGPITLNQKADGFNGIWYMNTPLDSEYRFKYSGGLATYTAKHRPFAIFRREVNKTFFVFGGTSPGSHERVDLAARGGDRDSIPGLLLHMISYYDHETGLVARPTIVLDKMTRDAHDNPALAIDDEGYIWIFSSSHGRSRPSFIHRSTRPYDIDQFELVEATTIEDGTEVPLTNFSYVQPWYVPGEGFAAFVTRYNYPVDRTPCLMTSRDGIHWSVWQRIAAIELGHYQVSATSEKTLGTALNMHPDMSATETLHGLNWRTNLYYVESDDFGQTWHAADGTPLELPLKDIDNPALVYDYQREGLLVYLKDIRFDRQGNPVILYITSKGYEAGPQNAPRTWIIAHWSGKEWKISTVATSDNNYDMGPVYLEEDGTWRIIAPTESGPQPYNPGGEVAMWVGRETAGSDRKWSMEKQLTKNSLYNHTYVRQPLHAHPDFYAFWADGHGREPSESRLYFATRDGKVYRLPRKMDGDLARLEALGDGQNRTMDHGRWTIGVRRILDRGGLWTTDDRNGRWTMDDGR